MSSHRYLCQITGVGGFVRTASSASFRAFVQSLFHRPTLAEAQTNWVSCIYASKLGFAFARRRPMVTASVISL